ncbi:BTAD domain-containing putative transcriptional regulator [Streptomyces sp. 4N509B]|uniref:BTAD domain-containing putative transcriptional regulator n=1 Tax=Streptomyces sp. 4N509B TaxID=3457413 RepID=UPI003FCF21A6
MQSGALSGTRPWFSPDTATGTPTGTRSDTTTGTPTDAPTGVPAGTPASATAGTQFRLLGPLEVTVAGRPVPLGGTKQRAALGLLLLEANRVVPTRRLLAALWPAETAPPTARKVLQNAVVGLRAALSDAPGVSLLTRPPGYTLRVAPQDVDLHRFHHLADAGREALAAGDPAGAATALREALALWRGTALADLVEAGIDWPSLTALDNARSAAVEDYVEAELSRGQPARVVDLLQPAVEDDPLRERTCGQLMLALYRCGRQADALAVYARTRAALTDALGLEPGNALRSLHQAILRHDPALTPAPGPDTARRRQLSVVLVRTAPGEAHQGAAPAQLDAHLQETREQLGAVVARFGGTLLTTIGSVGLALFATGSPEADARDAVHTALALRRTLTGGTRARLRQVVVATGEALLLADPPAVTGALLDTAHALLADAPPGDVRACDATRHHTAGAVAYEPASPSPPAWRVVDEGDAATGDAATWDAATGDGPGVGRAVRSRPQNGGRRAARPHPRIEPRPAVVM